MRVISRTCVSRAAKAIEPAQRFLGLPAAASDDQELMEHGFPSTAPDVSHTSRSSSVVLATPRWCRRSRNRAAEFPPPALRAWTRCRAMRRCREAWACSARLRTGSVRPACCCELPMKPEALASALLKRSSCFPPFAGPAILRMSDRNQIVDEVHRANLVLALSRPEGRGRPDPCDQRSGTSSPGALELGARLRELRPIRSPSGISRVPAHLRGLAEVVPTSWPRPRRSCRVAG